MCGLFGFVAVGGNGITDEHLDRGQKALHSLAHRGPDQWSEWCAGPMYMGHRRLSILDLSDAGRQPMSTGDGRMAVSVNGEIYNHKLLRAALGEQRFRSGSDSEVVLHGSLTWGIGGLLPRLDGMFALVVANSGEGTITLARDRVGIKPLYYGLRDGLFAWASELKALEAFWRPSHSDYDATALYDALTYRYVPAPKTLYRDIFKVRPAEMITVRIGSGSMVRRKFWSLSPELGDVTEADAREKVRELVSGSVTAQLMSDVPIGVFLSGGVDSSILLAQAAPVNPELQSFSVGFADHPEKSEVAHAREIARQFGVTARTELVSEADSEDFVGFLRDVYDEPFADPSALPTARLCTFARKSATVAIGGDGADELFGGYRWYRRFNQWRRFHAWRQRLRIPALSKTFTRPPTTALGKIRNRVSLASLNEPLALYQALMPGLLPAERAPYREMLGIPADYDDLWYFRQFWKPDLGPWRSLQYLDFHTFLPDDILTKIDRVSMAVSLEVRVPFLSNDLVEFAFSLPEDLLYGPNRELKWLLKQSFQDDRLKTALERPKQGFSPPSQAWRRTMLSGGRTLQEAVVNRFIECA